MNDINSKQHIQPYINYSRDPHNTQTTALTDGIARIAEAIDNDVIVSDLATVEQPFPESIGSADSNIYSVFKEGEQIYEDIDEAILSFFDKIDPEEQTQNGDQSKDSPIVPYMSEPYPIKLGEDEGNVWKHDQKEHFVSTHSQQYQNSNVNININDKHNKSANEGGSKTFGIAQTRLKLNKSHRKVVDRHVMSKRGMSRQSTDQDGIPFSIFDKKDMLKLIETDRISKQAKLRGKQNISRYLQDRLDDPNNNAYCVEYFRQVQQMFEIEKKQLDNFKEILEEDSKFEICPLDSTVVMYKDSETAETEMLDIVPFDDWFLVYLKYMIPNDMTLQFLEKNFAEAMQTQEWSYYSNYKGQPHFYLHGGVQFQRSPLRCNGQIANFYEPYIIRKRSNPHGINITQAMCPYCPVSKDNFRNLFFGRNDSEYLHHVTKHHGVDSTGNELKIPLSVLRLDSRNKWFALCPYCIDLVPVKNPFSAALTHAANSFVGYFRHVDHKHKDLLQKKNNGCSREFRKLKVLYAALKNGLHYS